MILENVAKEKRKVIDEFFNIVDSIPKSDRNTAKIYLRSYEYDIVLEYTQIQKPWFFQKRIRYGGITLIESDHDWPY